MIVPVWFCVGILVWLGLRGIRKWVEVLVEAAAINKNDEEEKEDKDEPMSDSVKHMYN